MNFTQSFEEFSRGLSTTDLFLYAGIGLILWVLFKDKLSPIQSLLGTIIDNVKGLLKVKTVGVPPAINSNLARIAVVDEDLFFKLVVSWKETRDLAIKCGCEKAVEVADTMFPYLSPNVCGKESE